MKTYQVTVSGQVKAPAEHVYAILADYHDGHPHILPRPYFQNLTFETGGIGAGTLIRFQMRVLGETQTLRAMITEPEPGRVLAETDVASGAVTSFTVAPIEEGRHTATTISTKLRLRDGFLGRIQRFFTTLFLRRIYAKELIQLANLAEERSQLPRVA
jgi:hypothetical protein